MIFTGASGRNGYLEVMKKMAEKYKKKMWGSVFVASSRSVLADAFIQYNVLL